MIEDKNPNREGLNDLLAPDSEALTNIGPTDKAKSLN